MRTVLIADDAAFMRAKLKAIVEKNGYQVVGEAENGKEAIIKYFELKPDLVTMDITMPVMDGIQAVKHIHDEDPLARIVMVTAIGQRSVITDAIKAGASSFIIKPFDPEQVEETINKVLLE